MAVAAASPGPGFAGEPAAAPVPPLTAGSRGPTLRAAGPDAWQDAEGRIHRLYRPRFLAAPDLFADVQSFGLTPVDVSLDPVRSRLLLTCDPKALDRALEALAWLDVPTPEVLVEIAIVEVARRGLTESGGHLLFDRGAPEGSPDTFFRRLRYDFEPDSWLRSQLLGGTSFQGTSANFGHSEADGWLAGTVGAVLRGLAHEGEAEFLTAPSLVCTEGVPAHVEATTTLPVSLFLRKTGQTPVVEVKGVTERAGVVLEVLAERIGTDRVRLAIHPWIRQVESSSSEVGPASYPVLSVRELSTTVELADGETIVVGGIAGLDRLGSRGGLPGLNRLPAVDSWLSAHSKGCASTDLLVLLKARILRPGRAAAPFAPPGENARRCGPGAAVPAATYGAR